MIAYRNVAYTLVVEVFLEAACAGAYDRHSEQCGLADNGNARDMQVGLEREGDQIGPLVKLRKLGRGRSHEGEIVTVRKEFAVDFSRADTDLEFGATGSGREQSSPVAVH